MKPVDTHHPFDTMGRAEAPTEPTTEFGEATPNQQSGAIAEAAINPEAYREKIIDTFLRSGEGTFGAITNLDLEGSDYRPMDRWETYGSSDAIENSKRLTALEREDTNPSQALIIEETPDGYTNFCYDIVPQHQFKNIGREPDKLTLAFSLPTVHATLLREQLNDDPTLMHDLAKGIIGEIGLRSSEWDESIRALQPHDYMQHITMFNVVMGKGYQENREIQTASLTGPETPLYFNKKVALTPRTIADAPSVMTLKQDKAVADAALEMARANVSAATEQDTAISPPIYT